MNDDAAGDATALAGIRRQIMWNRLIAVVEEQAQTLIRTAFSTTVPTPTVSTVIQAALMRASSR